MMNLTEKEMAAVRFAAFFVKSYVTLEGKKELTKKDKTYMLGMAETLRKLKERENGKV